MTVGQRIAQRRRELGLSQEGLGERLGVSRQAIYKWESDAALPEIEKLVNLSREFSVSIDWLLGQADETREPQELTPEQLRMVEEIVGRYLDALPKPEASAAAPDPEGESGTGAAGVRFLKGWGLSWVWLAALVVMAMVMFNLFQRLDQMRQENQNLQMSVANIRSDVNSQIYGITSRVEDILQSQNTLTAEQSVEVADTDYRANTISIDARAVPRTYVEGMTAEFTLVSGGESVTVPGELGENHAFTARLTGPLTDEITVSAAFLIGEQRQTQVLDQLTYLYSWSFPEINMSGGMSSARRSEGDGAWTASFGTVDVYCIDQTYGGPASLPSLRLGLFRDQKLVQWFAEDENASIHQDGHYSFRLEPGTVQLEFGHTYCVAAVVEDEFDREWVVPGEGHAVTVDGLERDGDWELSRDPADWEY